MKYTNAKLRRCEINGLKCECALYPPPLIFLAFLVMRLSHLFLKLLVKMSMHFSQRHKSQGMKKADSSQIVPIASVPLTRRMNLFFNSEYSLNEVTLLLHKRDVR